MWFDVCLFVFLFNRCSLMRVVCCVVVVVCYFVSCFVWCMLSGV